MAEKSTIEWTDTTWNPVTGCTKISAGCDNCYAARFSERFRGVPGHPFRWSPNAARFCRNSPTNGTGPVTRRRISGSASPSRTRRRRRASLTCKRPMPASGFVLNDCLDPLFLFRCSDPTGGANITRRSPGGTLTTKYSKHPATEAEPLHPTLATKGVGNLLAESGDEASCIALWSTVL
jgi:hypothetical protein